MPKHHRLFLVAGLCFLACFLDAHGASTTREAGSRYTIDVWENDDGLPQNSIISMTQTRDGYLWLGTINGLVRFDGVRFTVFDEYSTPGMSSSPVISLFEDSHDNLWIGTETAGVVLVRNGRVINLGIGRGSREQQLAAMAEDAAGAVWLYTADGQLWRYENGATNTFRVGSEYPSQRRALIVEKSGPIWIGMDRGQMALSMTDVSTSALNPSLRIPVKNRLDLLLASKAGGYWRLADGQVQKWKTNHLERVQGVYPWDPDDRVTTACEDREGNLIVGTLGHGVWWLDAQGNTNHLSTTNGLSNNYVLSLLVDREGTLWVGTDGGGLCRVKRQAFDTAEQTRGLPVQSISEGPEGLWLGFNSIGGFGVAEMKGGTLDRYGTVRGLWDSSVRSVLVDREQRVWVGTVGSFSGLYQKRDERFEWIAIPKVGRSPVSAIHQARTGKLWLGTQNGLAGWEGGKWQIVTRREGLSADEVRALADDREGNLWVGTRGGGLNRWSENRWTALHQKDGLPSEDVSALYADDDGVLWVGTSGSGLARFHSGKWTRYSIREGLVGNSIAYMIEDGLGNLWLGSNQGLMRVQKKALNEFARGSTTFIPVRAFGRPDGMPTRECTSGSQPAACQARDGRLWFPTAKGLVSINPAHIEQNTNPPPVIIEAVRLDDEAQSNGLRSPPLQQVIMAAGQERLEIEYSSLNLSAPDRAQFKYRLEGHETKWIEAGNSRVARYSKPPPGTYRFQVIACNEDGVWNETGSSLAVIVQPPFWRTWWFTAASTVCLLGVIVGIVHYLSTQKLQRQLEGLRQQEAIEKERSRIARDIHDQLGANLTQVSLLGELVESDRNSPDEVAAHAKQISQTALETSRALDEIVWTVNPQNDTLEGLISYFCKYAQEYLTVAGLSYRLDVPPQLPDAPISPEVRHNVFLAGKEAITNVVRHAHATSAWVRLKVEPDRFTMEIQDNGRGPAGAAEERAQSRNGLRNMAKRMEDVGGSFAIAPAPERGTLVRLTAPLAHR
jgi:ligand-binding sensor domain-containing protein/signal transduction histidine kinase